VSILSERTGASGTLDDIDRALIAAEETMCFCGCGRLVDRFRPSLYFYGQTCSVFWHLSQQHPDPEAWRAEQRAMDPEDRVYCGPSEGYDMPRPGPLPGYADPPSAFDRLTRADTDLERRTFRRGLTPQEQARAQDAADRAAGRPHGWTERVMEAFRRVVRPPTREELRERATVDLRDALAQVMNTDTAAVWAQLAADERAEQLRAGGTWSITYVGGGRLDDPAAGTTWRVDVGDLSEFVHVGPNHSHHRIVMACVERLREQQRGRL
jgi:hypothetical protein